MAKRILVLDIGASALKLAEYSLSGGALSLSRYSVAPLPAPADTAEEAPIITAVLEEMARESGIKPGPVAIAVSGQTAFMKSASIPHAGNEERFDQLVRYEIEQNMPFPIDEMVCDRQVLGETENGEKSVMIVAAKTDYMEAVAAAVQAAGFSPTLVDVAPLALMGAVRGVRGDEGCVVMLDIGAKTSSLVIAEEGRLYDRSIPVAGNNITRDIAAAFECSAEEAEEAKRERAYVSPGGAAEDEDEATDRISKICRSVLTRLTAEISRSINFYRSQQGGGVPVKLYLTGGTALLPQIDEFFAESLQIEVEFFNPFEAAAVLPTVDASALEGDSAFLGSAAGLALRVAGGSASEIDLLPPSLVDARSDSARLPAVAVAGLAVAGAAVLALLTVQHRLDVSKETLDAVNSRVSTVKAADMKVTKASGDYEAVAAKSEKFRTLLLRRSRTLSEIATVRRALSDGMWIEKWVGEPGSGDAPRGARVTVRGWADEMKAIVERSKGAGGSAKSTASEVVLERLKMSPDVDPGSVQIAEMTTIGKNAELEQFVVTLKFGGKRTEGAAE